MEKSNENSLKCPVCNEPLVKIVYGLPAGETIEMAKQRKVFLGGCIVMPDNPKYHCYQCRKSFSEDLKTSIDENDDWMQMGKNYSLSLLSM